MNKNEIDIINLPEYAYSIWMIVCHETGIYWDTQADHFGCDRPSAEGFVIPFKTRYSYPEWARDSHPDWEFDVPGDLCELSDRWTSEDRMSIARQIDKSLKECPSSILIRDIGFDYDRIDEMMEGWIPVKLEIGHAPKKGYLCTGNCD